jgi:hypothetical protein
MGLPLIAAIFSISAEDLHVLTLQIAVSPGERGGNFAG